MKITLLISIFIAGYISKEYFSSHWKKPRLPFPNSWRTILNEHVTYYQLLNNSEKKTFETRVQTFIQNVNILGFGTKVTNLDRLLVASSSVIPVFSFPNYKYTFLKEVILFPEYFTINVQDRKSLKMKGLVGYDGYFSGKILLSRKALLSGFKKNNSHLNVGIHEFVHLIDQEGSEINGIPRRLIKKAQLKQWREMMKSKMEDIISKNSDIRDYGGTRRGEFLAVVTEYFFEDPIYLQERHPNLYALLSKIYKQNPAKRKLQFMNLEEKNSKPIIFKNNGLELA